MKHTEGTFRGTGSTDLVYQNWKPDTQERAVVAIVHGVGEHSGRYMNVVDCLVPQGYAIYGFDLRGHGRSPGQRGYINSFEEFREDVHAYLKMICEKEPGLPLFLLGHSLGGLIVLEYVLHYPEGLQGVIASGPAVGKVGLPPVLFALSRILSRVYPRFSLKTGLDDEAISRNPAVVEAYKNDPLVHGVGTARLATEVVAAQKWTMEHASEWKPPLLIIHGGADRLADPGGSREFFDKVKIKDKQRIEYKDAYHECYNDIIYEQVVADMAKWLQEHIK